MLDPCENAVNTDAMLLYNLSRGDPLGFYGHLGAENSDGEPAALPSLSTALLFVTHNSNIHKIRPQNKLPNKNTTSVPCEDLDVLEPAGRRRRRVREEVSHRAPGWGFKARSWPTDRAFSRGRRRHGFLGRLPCAAKARRALDQPAHLHH